MDYAQWFSERLTQLRMEKGVSARDMSLSLGQSESYINKIENRRTMPSMTGFFYICEFLGIEPQEFFDAKTISPNKAAEIIEQIGKLSSEKADHILEVIKDLAEK
jgi:transcriptional regulator with XRE-family HTH domain